MHDARPVALDLPFVVVRFAVKAAFDVILIFAPGDAGHKLDAVAAILPTFCPFRKRLVHSINNGDVRADIHLRPPRRSGLEDGFFGRFLRNPIQTGGT